MPSVTVEYFINLLTSILGLYMAYSSIKLVFPWHPLYPAFAEGFKSMASAWGMIGYGTEFRWLVGLGKLLCGSGAALLVWLPGFEHLAGLSIIGIVLVMGGAVVTNFSKGWAATHFPAMLVSISVACLILQTTRGVLKEHSTFVLGMTLAGSLVFLLALYLRRRGQQLLSSEKLLVNNDSKTQVTVLTSGSDSKIKNDTYYRLI
jgi:hypothetical protein